MNIEWRTFATRVHYKAEQYSRLHIYSVVLQELWSVIDGRSDYQHFVGALYRASVRCV